MVINGLLKEAQAAVSAVLLVMPTSLLNVAEREEWVTTLQTEIRQELCQNV